MSQLPKKRSTIDDALKASNLGNKTLTNQIIGHYVK